MVWVDTRTKEINCKIVYYGCGMAGKTTNLQYIYDVTPKADKGKLISLSPNSDHILFFGFLPSNIRFIRQRKIRFYLYTVPGACFYDSSKRDILEQADGIVFVADSTNERLEANIESFADLNRYLSSWGYSFLDMPYVLQLNKRDISSLSVDELKKELTYKEEPVIESIAYKGIGVLETFNTIADLVAKQLNNWNGLKYSPKQGHFLSYIYYYTKIHKYSPSQFEIAKYFNVSLSGVNQMLQALEKKGLVEFEGGNSECIRLLLKRNELPDLE